MPQAKTRVAFPVNSTANISAYLNFTPSSKIHHSRRYSEVMSGNMKGVEACPVSVQVNLTSGLSAFHIVGLGDTAVKESHRRVTAALKNSGFRVPGGVITVNLAPALLNKSGTGFDLAIALGILLADDVLPANSFSNHIVVGELGLDGSVSNVRGMVGHGLLARQKSKALVCSDASIFDDLFDLPIIEIRHLKDLHNLSEVRLRSPEKCKGKGKSGKQYSCGDFADVVGQQQAVRALTIAASGNHNILMVGPPGTGKTMLASRLPSILPSLDSEELIETALVHSVADSPFDHYLQKRPFRAPHHSATSTAIVGGGNPIRPGEVSLAHNGVLFLDEMPQFSRNTLQSLRQPIEDREIRIVRAQGTFCFPTDFMLVGAANPCPCGYLGDQHTACRCLPNQIEQYQNRIGGPLIDRFSMFVTVPRPHPDQFFEEKGKATPSSEELAELVRNARSFSKSHGRPSVQSLSRNQLCSKDLIEVKTLALMKRASHSLKLSGRAIVGTLRLARTIADMEQSTLVNNTHLSEALSYRKTWSSHD